MLEFLNTNEIELRNYLRIILRNSVREELENIHVGTSPSSKTGDFSDVKVVSPYGEIPWNEVSRINDSEMRSLMLAIEEKLLSEVIKWEQSNEEHLQTSLEHVNASGASWDLYKEDATVKNFENNTYHEQHKDFFSLLDAIKKSPYLISFYKEGLLKIKTTKLGVKVIQPRYTLIEERSEPGEYKSIKAKLSRELKKCNLRWWDQEFSYRL